MEMFPGRVPYSKEETFTPLRAPHTLPAQSTLSVDAQEFVPQQMGNQTVAHQQQNYSRTPQYYQRQNHQYHNQQHYQQNGYQRMPQQHHQQQQNQYQQQQQQNQRMSTLANDVQDRLKIKGGNANTNQRANSGNYYSQHSQQRPSTSHQHQYQQHQHHQQQHSTSSSNYKSNREQETNSSDLQTMALDYLSTVIQCLNRNPGQFDAVATRFLTIFDGMENNQYVLSIAMEDIFKESTQNTNFRYMGAKLYNLLHMLNLSKDSLFLALLKCKLDYHQQEVLQYMEKKENSKVRETALFLAELYMQLRGDDSRIQLLAENIVYSLKHLLLSETVDNIRCICLTLKLAGYDLTNDCPIEVAEIINSLAEIEARTPSKYPIVASVLALQKDNWGRKLSSSISLTESEGMSEPPRASDEPIFYGPDGRELTAEETDFLAADAPAGSCVSSDDDDDVDDELDLEMDEDAAKAYKEFCKQNAASASFTNIKE